MGAELCGGVTIEYKKRLFNVKSKQRETDWE